MQREAAGGVRNGGLRAPGGALGSAAAGSGDSVEGLGAAGSDGPGGGAGSPPEPIERCGRNIASGTLALCQRFHFGQFMLESARRRSELQHSAGQGPGLPALRQAARRPVRRWRGPVAVPAQPHDTLFRALTESPRHADRLVRDALPPAFAELLSDAPGRLLPGSFVDSGLRTVQADRLLEFTLRDGRSALVYVLLEHKSSVDPGTPLQLLGYMVKIWQQHHSRSRGGRLRLPPIIPLVFRHGEGLWTVPPSVLAMIDAPEPLLAFARSLEYVLVDLGGIPFGRLASDPVLRAGLGLLKFASRGPVPAEAAVQIREVLVRLRAEDALLEACLKYIDVVMPDEAAAESPEDGPGTKENLMATMAQRWLQEGKAEGKAEVLLRLLMRRFGAVPDAVKARVRAAVGADLDAWLDAILEAPDLESVFASRSMS